MFFMQPSSKSSPPSILLSNLIYHRIILRLMPSFVLQARPPRTAPTPPPRASRTGRLLFLRCSGLVS
jgi:hypothetical protein